MTAMLLLAVLAAPAPYLARLETSKGAIVIEVVPSWAPRAAARFRELVENGFYDDSRFFRVVAGKWVQFGISGDPRAKKWPEFPDEDAGLARHTNSRGTVGFAFAVPNGRGTQVFINLGDNSRLDAQGFAPFGRVVQGMDVVDALYSGYGEESGGGIRGGKQGPLLEGGNAWLDAHFPRLDKLLHATIIH
jgi:peptidyl-prolyl cis-trans isomerase A (cyclophilin A)